MKDRAELYQEIKKFFKQEAEPLLKKYEKERKQVDKYFIEATKKDNLIEWENFLNYFEKLIEEESINGN